MCGSTANKENKRGGKTREERKVVSVREMKGKRMQHKEKEEERKRGGRW